MRHRCAGIGIIRRRAKGQGWRWRGRGRSGNRQSCRAIAVAQRGYEAGHHRGRPEQDEAAQHHPGRIARLRSEPLKDLVQANPVEVAAVEAPSGILEVVIGAVIFGIDPQNLIWRDNPELLPE